MITLYERHKKHADRTVRCYLTLHCNAMCNFCSADIPKLSVSRRQIYIPAEFWAEGLNRRKRMTLLAGGEPLIYPEFPKLISLIDNTYKVEIFTNLIADIKPFLNSARRKFVFVVSLHPATKNIDDWIDKIKLLINEKHSVRIHVVTLGNYIERIDYIRSKGIQIKITGQKDQRFRIKSQENLNLLYSLVSCTSRIFLFGPDGYRYHCVHKLGIGENKMEHISENDRNDWHELKCTDFGYCAPCDSNIEGKVIYDII